MPGRHVIYKHGQFIEIDAGQRINSTSGKKKS